MSGAEGDALRDEAARLRATVADLERRLAAAGEAAARLAGTAAQRRWFITAVWQGLLGREPSVPETDHLAAQLDEAGPMAFVTELAGGAEAAARRAAGRHAARLGDVAAGQRRCFAATVWQACLGREPSPAEADHLASQVESVGPLAFATALAQTDEAVAHRTALAALPALFVPPGHYYSPVVDPAHLPPRPDPGDLPAVALPWDRMAALSEELARHGEDLAFPAGHSPNWRYYAANGMYGPGDAAILACMVRHLRPRRYMEVGSGFSSAVVLDTLDRTPGLHTACTFIEPHPQRLHGLLRDHDGGRATVIESRVQDVPTALFDQLEPGDILFLDTTHVSKTGSDVNHELFAILPRLRRGVVVHFHDVFDGFEYPAAWIHADNRSWNEIYLLRAFLMYNAAFEVLYANAAFGLRNPGLLERRFAVPSVDPGAGLWLRKTADPG